jgi:hypothetical protein
LALHNAYVFFKLLLVLHRVVDQILVGLKGILASILLDLGILALDLFEVLVDVRDALLVHADSLLEDVGCPGDDVQLRNHLFQGLSELLRVASDVVKLVGIVGRRDHHMRSLALLFKDVLRGALVGASLGNGGLGGSKGLKLALIPGLAHVRGGSSSGFSSPVGRHASSWFGSGGAGSVGGLAEVFDDFLVDISKVALPDHDH